MPTPRVRAWVERARWEESAERFHEAAELYKQVARACRDAGDRASQSQALLACGICLVRAGFDAQAVEAFQRAVSCSEVAGDELGAARGRMQLGRHHLERGRPEQAVRALARCAEVLAANEAHEELGWVADRMVTLHVRRGDLEEALTYGRLAVQAASDAPDRARYGLRLAAMGGLHRRAGHDGPARAYLTKALPHLRDGGHHEVLHDALWTLAELAEGRGDHEERLDCLEEALIAAMDAGHVVERAQAELALAEALTDDARRMRGLVVGATMRLYACPADQVRAATWLKLAALQGQLGDRAQASRALRRARASARRP